MQKLNTALLLCVENGNFCNPLLERSRPLANPRFRNRGGLTNNSGKDASASPPARAPVTEAFKGRDKRSFTDSEKERRDREREPWFRTAFCPQSSGLISLTRRREQDHPHTLRGAAAEERSGFREPLR
ncbi:hypothetical protein AOLI_G00274980 [Acnodon oligacanthus]